MLGQRPPPSRRACTQAFTLGREIFFGAGRDGSEPVTRKRLLAHELAHVVQQRSTSEAPGLIQRADLSSPRLAGNPLFEDVLDNTEVIEFGHKGPKVRRIQQLLIDLGFSLPIFGADGDFGAETKNAVKAFQISNPPRA